MRNKTRRLDVVDVAVDGADAVDGVDPVGELEGGSSRIRSDLESRGVAPELSLPAAQRLSAIAADLTPKEYGAVLDGVAAAYVQSDGGQAAAGDVSEIQRLMEGFTSELRKLEEGLQILSAYVVRMGSRSSPERPTTLH